MTYALGRSVEYYDMPAVRAIVREAARNGNRMSSFIAGVVKSAAFQMSKAESPALTNETTDLSAPARRGRAKVEVQPRASKASRR
jgi:hypothetical protein